MIAKCPHCNSIWVCWNWMHFLAEQCYTFNPDGSKNYKPEHWAHECHICEHAFETNHKVYNGVPYFLLRLRGKIC